MHEVIKVYGKTILQAIILVGVMWLVFRGVTDENGNKGIVDIKKAWDYAENELQIQLMKVISPDGTVLENKLDFQMPGVYEVSVMTEDHDNRVRYAVVNIPVNE